MIFNFSKDIIPEPKVRKLTHSEIVANDIVDPNYKKEELPTDSPHKMAMNKIYYNTLIQNWDGEKNVGELGSPIHYIHNHESLSVRSWQTYAESDVAKILVTASVEWIIGKGLNLQSEPIKEIIESEGYTLDENFTFNVENRFRLLTKTKRCSHNRRMTLGQLARQAYKHAIIGGDCVVIFRFDGYPTVEIVDGRHVKNPGPPYEQAAKNRGNKIKYGVEITPSGEHYAYYIQKCDREYEQVLCRGENTDRVTASMIYGDEYRVDSVRGIPIYSTSIEKMKKMDRYIEAMVGGAEERAKVPYFFFHNHFSEGENPMWDQMNQAYNAAQATGTGVGKEDLVQDLDQLGAYIALSSGKEPYNLPIGVDLKAIQSTQELNLPEFVDSLFIYTCASIGMPYEIALMKFVNSYSASRMASQSWQTIMENKREAFSSDFYQPYYELFMYTQILDNKINAEGYLAALREDDVILQGAYNNARFIGKNVPQADPSKEVKAEVLKLQHNLTNFDKSSEALGTGDFVANVKSMAKQYQMILDNIPEEFITKPNPETDTSELPDD